MVSVDNFFFVFLGLFFFFFFFCFGVAVCDLVRDVRAVYGLYWVLIASGFFFL